MAFAAAASLLGSSRNPAILDSSNGKTRSIAAGRVDDERKKTSSRPLGCSSSSISKHQRTVRAATSDGGVVVDGSEWGEPISLGTAKLPLDVDVSKVELLLFQWANSLTQNASLPLEVPLKVDRVEGGVRLSYIRVSDGVVEDLVYIDATITTGSSQPFFQALRNGKLKNSVPPGEPAIMRSMLQALRTSVNLARPQK